jgi:hypothetical protein
VVVVVVQVHDAQVHANRQDLMTISVTFRDVRNDVNNPQNARIQALTRVTQCLVSHRSADPRVIRLSPWCNIRDFC